MQQLRINKIFTALAAANPNPQTELLYTNNFTLLIAVILSAQATDKSVNKATESLFVEYNTPSKMLNLGLSNLKQHIKTIGLFNTKANNIIELCNILTKSDETIIPTNLIELMKLPGVGRKTANVYLNAHHGQRTIAVDTHVARVSLRLGLTNSTAPLNVEKDLLAIIPKKWQLNAHNWLVLHGRYICKARTPLCNRCLVKDFCQYYSGQLIKKS